MIDDWAWEIIRLINSYTEISPSGTGIRIFCYGKLPPGRRKNGNVEMYDESSPKYLTITDITSPAHPERWNGGRRKSRGFTLSTWAARRNPRRLRSGNR